MKNFGAFAAILGGFLFGYQTAVISGAQLFLKEEFALTPFSEGMVVSIVLLGALCGAMSAGLFADWIGRKKTIFLTSLLFLVGTLLSMFASSSFCLLVGRFITGVGVGIVSVIAPMYLAELSPPEKRGKIVSLCQLFTTIGILVAYGVNLLFAKGGNWRWMFGCALVPIFLQITAIFFAPESPKTPSKSCSWKFLLDRKMRFLVFIGIMLNVFQQITGINTVIYFAPKIFQMAGFVSIAGAIFATVGVGVVNVLGSLLPVWLLDRFGRRPLLLAGTFGMLLSLSLLVFAFWSQSSFSDELAVVSLMSYVVCFAIGFGPVPGVMVSELYPSEVRGKAMSAALFANWGCNYLVSLTFLNLVAAFGSAGAFSLYAVLAIVALWFVFRFVPETKNQSLA